MRQQRVYDLPTRFFHWAFAGLFVAAYFLAQVFDEETILFSFHVLAGLLLVLVVGFRLIWGLIGPQPARISQFALRPGDLVSYLKGVWTGSRRRWSGPNPAASWAAIAMMAIALGLGTTGYLMGTGFKSEWIEEAHELLANGFLIVVLLHLCGIALHSLRHREQIALSMVDGMKSVDSDAKTRGTQNYYWAAAVFLLVMGTAAAQLNRSFDRTTRTLQVLGTALQLGEAEETNESGEGEGGDDDGDDD